LALIASLASKSGDKLGPLQLIISVYLAVRKLGHINSDGYEFAFLPRDILQPGTIKLGRNRSLDNFSTIFRETCDEQGIRL
jgi:hypothetical protein